MELGATNNVSDSGASINGMPVEAHDPSYLDAYRRSIQNPAAFWEQLGKLLDWDRPWKQVLDNSNPPFTKWYVGGYLNACYNAIDRHILAGKGDKVALIHDSPLTDTIRHVTYQELYDQIILLAGGLTKLGVEKGDRVVIYMPLIPETIIAMLAVVRLGAVHSVVFGGFAARELCSRIEHVEPKIVIAANAGVEPGKVVPYLDIMHSAINMSRWKPEKHIIYMREKVTSPGVLDAQSDLLWSSVLNMGKGGQAVPCVPIEANDPLYILYTSGTTNKPKGVLRTIGGHLVALMYTLNKIYGVNAGDTWWAASDMGWVVGHSYICYGPLCLGATSVMYEGKPDRTPDPGQYFRIIDQHKVCSIFSVPTSFRVIRRADPDISYGRQYSMKSLRAIFIAGEHCDFETKMWIQKTFKVPVLNHWWQTETGSAVTATCLGFNQNLDPPMYSTGLPLVGYDIKVLKPDGTESQPMELGRIVLKLPLPPGNMATLYRSDDLYRKLYFQKFPGYYDTMDAGYRDELGYVFVTARDDDVINVAGHRLSTSSLEDAVLRHPDVVDVAVFGVPEATKGQVPLCLYIPVEGCTKTDAKLSAEIIKLIRDVVGPIAAFRLITSVNNLPRTRSGKTMRKAMADFAKNERVVLPATIDDASVFIEIRRALQHLGYAMSAPDPIVAKLLD
ncbi:acyl-CoA synthetase short-chain family member 3, mitochondrial isoform X2 [Scaptodrosophila lebanonensis]|uniref:Acyl-CoA synthetase short-chain family member 3, mitochondrial n=1 Tax=Drosophila lebanonensis TaxID=7225 RepID=A0A6J2TLI6_DROLE|nr:acyl-CoA synthetase short-chain family member 3, mitochondrial isoform X2 [Scaptodrosophila lebanonensis]